MSGWVAGAVVVGGVVGAVGSSIAAGKAASAQRDAANTASNTQLSMYDTTRTDQAPWRAAGTTALGQIGAGTRAGGEFNRNFTAADFNADPGYAFRLAQGEKGVENSGSARGMTLSGAQLKGLDQYNQGFASNEYQNAYNRFNNDQTTRFNRLSSIAGLGQTATAQTGQAGAYAANGIANAQIGAGNAAAAGYVGQANAINSGASTLANYYMQRQYMGGGGGNPYGGGMPYNGGSAGASPYVSGTPYGSGANSGDYCDYALKCDVTRVGVDGVSALPVYDFWYVGQDQSEPKWRGYMAQDVQATYPEAVSRGPRGYLKVDHDQVPSSAPYPLKVPTDAEWLDLDASIDRSNH